NKLHEKAILHMIERLYGDEVKQTKYDLIFCIKSFMKMYTELFLFENIQLDFALLSQTLVEKTNLLAEHMTLPFITEEYNLLIDHGKNLDITKEQLITIIDKNLSEM